MLCLAFLFFTVTFFKGVPHIRYVMFSLIGLKCLCGVLSLLLLQMLLSDFSHHHIEMACTLLETCGRFLFRSPESHLRTSVLLVRA